MSTGTDIRYPEGWYPDPLGRAERRYWSGRLWTAWVYDGEAVTADSTVHRRMRPSDVASLEFIQTVFLPAVRAEVSVSTDQVSAMSDLARSMIEEAVTPEAQAKTVRAGPVVPPVVVHHERLGPASRAGVGQPGEPGWQRATPDVGSTGARTPVARAPAVPESPRVPRSAPPAVPPTVPSIVPLAARTEPSPGLLSRWWTRSLASISSDLALHGLAYLGVLLLFVGSFGLVAFAFGDIAPDLRPAAELALALVPFAAARLLLQRGAVVAGRSLELAGGLLLPIMVITSFLDGVGVPPDLTGPALVLAMTGSVGALSVAYAAWSARHPRSALRFLVAPTAWLSIGLAASGVGRAIPSGSGVASVTAAQVGALTAAMVVTAAAARLRPLAHLAAPTLTASLVGAPVVGLLAALSWVAESFPSVPIAVTGVLGLVLIELLSTRLGPDRTAIAQVSWWAVVWLGLINSPVEAQAQVAALALAGFVALLESASARRTTPWVLGLPAAGALWALVATWQDPWWAAAATAAAAVWVTARRAARVQMVELAPWAFDLGTAILPASAVAALWWATDEGPAALAIGAALVLASTVPATRPVLRRTPDDRFWARAWAAWLVLAAVAIALFWITTDQQAQTGQWLIVGAVALLALAAGSGPVRVVVRLWCAAALGGWAWLLVCHAAGLPSVAQALVVAVAALVAVVAGNAAKSSSAEFRGNLALVGHAFGAAALVLPSSSWALTAIAALATTGWLVTSWYDERDRSPVGSLLAGVTPWLRYGPPAIAALGIPTTAALALHTAGMLTWSAAWGPIVPAATAVVYAAGSRLPVNPRTASCLAVISVVAALLAPMLATQTWTAALALACLIASVALMTPSRRPGFMIWIAWAAVAPLVGLIAVGTSGQFGALPPATSAAVTLLSVGGGLTLLAAGGVAGRSWGPLRGRSAQAVLRPLLTGAAEAAAGLALAWVAVPNPTAGWLTLAGSTIALGVALLSRAGILAGVSAALGWLAALMLAPDWILAHPWIGVAASAAALVACEVARRLPQDGRWWARWDLGLFAAAHLSAATALAITASDGELGFTWTATGLLALALAARMRAHPRFATVYGAAGVLLVLVAAWSAGQGWLALALAALSIALTVLGGWVHGAARSACQVGGALAALAAWAMAAQWQDWTTMRMLDATSVAAALIALGLAGALRTGRLHRSWVLTWGSVAALTTAATSTIALLPAATAVDPSLATTAALLILAVALAAAAKPLDTAWLRELAAVSLLAAEIHLLTFRDATPGDQVAVLSATVLLCALALLLTRKGPIGVRRPIGALGLVTSVAALAIGAEQLPDSMLLVPGLLAGAALAGASWVAFRSVWASVLAPVLACAAWLAYARDALGGNPQWYAVPIGVALLVVVALIRQDRRERGLDPAVPSIVPLELVGIGLVVGPSLVQSITVSLGYTLLAAVLGLCLVGWGTVTQVRRRVACGALTVLVAIIELVAVPLATLLPAWSGVWMWVLIIVVGLLALAAASLLEWARSAVRRAVTGFAEATEGWE